MSRPFALPDFMERKGSLFLRSDRMEYSRATLNSNWYQAREADPKDYDIITAPTRDLRHATYNRIGDVTDGTLPETTYQDHTQQIFRCKNEFEEKGACQSMVTKGTFKDCIIDGRDTGAPEKGYGAILPGHHPGHDKRYFDTTHRVDYKPPYPYMTMEEKMAAQASRLAQEEANRTAAYKKCISQFADSANHRRYKNQAELPFHRPGWNTWQDESGVYTNTHYKRQLYQPTKTITAAYE